MPPQKVTISQYFYFITGAVLLREPHRLPEINQTLTNKIWQQLSVFRSAAKCKKTSAYLSESPVPGAVENNLPMLVGRRNVTEWRTENFFPNPSLTSREQKAQRPFGRCAKRLNSTNYDGYIAVVERSGNPYRVLMRAARRETLRDAVFLCRTPA